MKAKKLVPESYTAEGLIRPIIAE
jgi:hypothetical protein